MPVNYRLAVKPTFLILFMMFFPLLNAAAESSDRCYRVFLHELGFDPKQRHVELSYEDEGKHIFFNAYNSKVDIEEADVLASSNSDLVFSIAMNEQEFKTFKELVEERRKGRVRDWCTLGACKVLKQSTGMFLPGPVTFFPRNLVYHMLMLRVFNPSRVVGVRFIGSKVIYFLIRQMSLGGTLEAGALAYGAYRIREKLKEPKKVDEYEVELESPSGVRSKKIIQSEADSEYRVHY